MNLNNIKISFITLIMLLPLWGDSGIKMPAEHKVKTNAIKPENDQEIMRGSDDSLTIAILSPEGKLIREIRYVLIDSDSKRQSKYSSEFLNHIKGYPDSDTITGDFNGDGKIEKAWFKDYGFAKFEDYRINGTKASCRGTILFSDKSIKPIEIDYCPFGTLKNEGDLYGDGKDAIGVLPGWFSSACREYNVFGLIEGRWKLVCPPIGNTLNMREAGIIPFEKDLVHKGWATIRESLDSYDYDEIRDKIPMEYLRFSSCVKSNVLERRIKLIGN